MNNLEWLKQHSNYTDYQLMQLTEKQIAEEVDLRKQIVNSIEMATDAQKDYLLNLEVDPYLVDTITKKDAINLLKKLAPKITPKQERYLKSIGYKNIPKSNDKAHEIISSIVNKEED